MLFTIGDDWTDCFTVNGFSLPSAPFLGVSAMTGDVSDNQEYVVLYALFPNSSQHALFCSIISVTTYSAILSSPEAQRDQFRNNRPTDAGSSWLWTIGKLLLFVAFVGGALHGYKTYVLRQAGPGGAKGGFGGMGMGPRSPSGSGGGLYGDSKRF